ncbi:bifunctional [glutamine synthetase] adenylyltransferase/[glutamine synthetase]-adenylyl-L-tyrosine phosphorylase [Roseococcus sp. SYP-B2431]|uniref:bifunctional [glutamine synthetase] adenylyltransferase/[glutamine synthetase]-adenylyl-L-tyrosine phosphorylase n=1 Tax=Roseococcus sp. SYP-B2431 TaxID=2496640 RepID=UPI00103D1932|nr:bifunctional [glutamine synthetase] adenylyltransferase/[glutamine synthetase]-adenylyl-L-tyrosine phosphorylase [Roseococcus sp. SYP-B2431]TCI00364.1 bifunctional [glutamine synthetase] adenylyltransferase/[glutamine synthetase]-adenylyl-L-tyrosine phosphorylase [Roseococcus sp. SYP-B2431]
MTPLHDPEAVQRLRDRLAAGNPTQQALGSRADAAPLLEVMGAHSSYLADLCWAEAPALTRLLDRGPEEAMELALDPLTKADPAAARDAVASLLRRAKRQGALVAAAADLSGAWSLDRVTQALSELADLAIDFACAHLLLEAARRGQIRLPRLKGEPKQITKGSGLIVLGMGKLGGRELNYSSDVDLLLLHDPDSPSYHEEYGAAPYVRLARDLVRLMEERTAEGYVFRTDLRLRPDPAATPLCVSVPMALSYYESLGQNWERAAMIKARPVAGDRAAGEAFLRELRPFVWRRHLDFAAVADIHSIKRQINRHKADHGAGSEIGVAGHDVKLGAGGIREIEFTVQVLELIWGGRDPALRDPTTLGALAALAAAGKLDRRAAADLADAYVFLRTTEHRLQMVADRQTHRLPEAPGELARIASFMGFADTPAFAEALTAHQRRVQGHYARLFEAAPQLSSSQDSGNLVFTGVDDDPETMKTLRGMGFRDPASVAAMVRSWHHGRPRAMRSERARELLTELMPALLAAFARQREPDAALARFDTLLQRMAAGVQWLSLLHRNPRLLVRLAGLLGAAPQLADHIARRPAALEGLLAGSYAAPGEKPLAALPALMREARDLDETLEATRRLVTEHMIEVDAAELEGRVDADSSGEQRSAIADAALAALLPAVQGDFARRFGKVAGGGLAILALGKLGGREMLPGSDLDLIFIYDHEPEAEASEGGARSLASSEYFIRLSHQVVAALTTAGRHGAAFEVDMRLRPSGNKGPVATRLSSFQRYHMEEAWTWERMALTRARVVAGPAPLSRQIAAAAEAALTAPRDAAKALADAASMRARMLRELPADGPWDLKAMPGGLMEVEFIAQAMTVAHAAEHPRLLRRTTRLVLGELGRQGLIDEREAATLIQAERLWRALLGRMRLTVGKWKEPGLPVTVEEALRLGAGTLVHQEVHDLAELRDVMAAHAASVRAGFERHLGSLSG